MAVSAYILIQADVGTAVDVASRTRALPAVVGADVAMGPYDVIARAEADSMDDLGQVVVGVVYQTTDDVEAAQFHQLYGFAAFASVGIIYAYRSEMRERPYLLYGLGSLWLMGLGIRAITL